MTMEREEDRRTAERNSLADRQVIKDLQAENIDLLRRVSTMENLMGRFIAGGLDAVQFSHLDQLYAAKIHTH